MNEQKAHEIANFLSENPEFFIEYEDIFISMKVPNPHGTGTISLLEKQIDTLRTRNKILEDGLEVLATVADDNKLINDSILEWCVQLVAEKNPHQLPLVIHTGLQKVFPELNVELKLWDIINDNHPYSYKNEEVQNWAQGLEKPYLGSLVLDSVKEWWSAESGSYALIPLRLEDKVVGILGFSHRSVSHFSDEMGTTFLQMIHDLVVASLSRLNQDEDEEFPELTPV
ncbi:DUF484 family protein [Taylorella equigenitalis]|uniref:DUF484 family protein n=1 Tax=Taylorella equigenitalis TaxID=29575 RepID=UPI0023B1EEB1|nr:DUF484 family protein [Taylorella equigenitalis]WEE00573.1 DUF484 family protein [Taylorella equigenitalis]WEE02050.1 DUF484 family protein [Taylorella equigenitalis]WFD78586.1 DUF484 family protein [Taylorella equigenitalis]WFD80064.1 DUF484 family protein [Taylorella equigenitalis]WFD81541.1 DUF484 family protein [Taylorella equigenitalis]